MSQKRLIALLKEVNFEERFLALCETHSVEAGMEQVPQEPVLTILKELGFKATYNKKEKFFKIKEKVNDFTVHLNIAFPFGIVEFILFIENKKQNIKVGGPFGRLLKELNPKIKRFQLPEFENIEHLQQILKEGLAIYDDIKENINLLEN